MRFNFSSTGDVDLAKEFGKLVLLRARCNDDPYQVVLAAQEAVRKKHAAPIVLEAARVESWGDLRREFQRQQKAAVATGTTFDSQWAGPLLALRTLADAWFASLINTSMLDALLQDAKPVPPNVLIALTSGIGTGVSAEEAMWTSLTSFDFQNLTTRAQKALALVVTSNDLLRFGDELAANLLNAELRNAVSIATDLVVADTLVSGLSPISSTGDPRKDLRTALAAIGLGKNSRPYVFVSPNMIKMMALAGSVSSSVENGPPTFPDLQVPNGGMIAGMPCLAVDALADFNVGASPISDCMIVVDAAQCAGDPGTLELLASNSASIQMANGLSPTSPEDEPQAATLSSMWQSNSTALRATRWFTFSRVRQTACAVVTDCSYSA